MRTSRAERSRLPSMIAINQHFLFGFGRFPDFHGFCCTPPSKIRKLQEIDQITRVNNIFVENVVYSCDFVYFLFVVAVLCLLSLVQSTFGTESTLVLSTKLNRQQIY